MKFLCTSTFASDIKKMRKRAGQYGQILADIGSEFSNESSFQSILSKGPLLFEGEDVKIMKIRVGNSTMKKGQRGGYRLIVMMLVTAEECIFLHAYPKAGSAAKADITKTEMLELAETFWEELEQGLLRPVDFGPALGIGASVALQEEA